MFSISFIMDVSTITTILIKVVGFILFFYILNQILVFMEIPTKYIFEYIIFFISLGILYLFLPSSVVSWT